MVSSHTANRDKISVKVLDIQFFADALGNFMKPETLLESFYLPRLATKSALAKVKSIGAVTSNTMTTVMFSNIAVTVAVAGPLQLILSAIK